MKVDFNNLRVQAMVDFNKLVSACNAHLEKDDDEVRIPVCVLAKKIEDLRQEIVVLACCYEENNPEYKSVIDEVELLVFNPDETETEST